MILMSNAMMGAAGQQQVSGGAINSPMDFSPELWLDASDPVNTTVDQINDKSGNGRHAGSGFGTRSIVTGGLNGLNVYQFSAGSKLDGSFYAPTTGFTIYYLASVDALTTNHADGLSMLFSAGKITTGTYVKDNRCAEITVNTEGIIFDLRNESTPVPAFYPYTLGEYYIVTVIVDYSQAKKTFRVNRNTIAEIDDDGTYTPNLTTDAYQLNAEVWSSLITESMRSPASKFAELFLVDGPMSLADTQAGEAYLSNKWGIAP